MQKKMNGEKPAQFRVTVKARMYHGVLHETMTRLGMNQAKMAEYLEISLDSLGKIMRLQKVPRFKTESEKRLKHKLEELTEITVSELFPKHIFTEEFLGQDKTIQVTKDIPIHLLENAGMVRQLTLPPDEELMLVEEENGKSIEETLEELLGSLSEREQKVMRGYFIEGKTLEQIAQEFGVTRARIAQIKDGVINEFKSPRKLRILGRFNPKFRSNDPFRAWLDEKMRLCPAFQKEW